jgi:UDP-N-acetylglucosamine transferase subunit ALG13
MIFVITGTERYPLDRMVHEVDRLVGAGIIKSSVFVQLGSSTYEPNYCDWKRFMSFGEMCEKIEKADTVIAHAGAGTTLLCVQLKHRPILFPRSKQFGEHIDDHQLSFAKKFETTGFINVAYELADLATLSQVSTKSPENMLKNTTRTQLIKHLDTIVEQLTG